MPAGRPPLHGQEGHPQHAAGGARGVETLGSARAAPDARDQTAAATSWEAPDAEDRTAGGLLGSGWTTAQRQCKAAVRGNSSGTASGAGAGGRASGARGSGRARAQALRQRWRRPCW